MEENSPLVPSMSLEGILSYWKTVWLYFENAFLLIKKSRDILGRRIDDCILLE